MKIKTILLSGTPASGKDTITQEVHLLDERFVHFRKHKIATGDKLDDTYIHVSRERFDEMVSKGDFIQYHYRYNRGYGVSKEELSRLHSEGKVPVIHVGKYENLSAFRSHGIHHSLSVLLYTSRDDTQQRLQHRHPDDGDEVRLRLNAYDEEITQLCKELDKSPKLDFDLAFNNTYRSPSEASVILHRIISEFESTLMDIRDILQC